MNAFPRAAVRVDDQALFRDALATLLIVRDDIEVVGEAANGNEAVRQAAELDPDVVLMDLRMPALDGIAAARRIRVERREGLSGDRRGLDRQAGAEEGRGAVQGLVGVVELAGVVLVDVREPAAHLQGDVDPVGCGAAGQPHSVVQQDLGLTHLHYQRREHPHQGGHRPAVHAREPPVVRGEVRPGRRRAGREPDLL
jgi:hypothetical protein